MSFSAVIAVGIVLGLMLAVAGLFRPFLGLLVFVLVHFAQPGELIPALAPFRIELVYGTLLIIRIMSRDWSRSASSFLTDRILRGAMFLIAAGLLSVSFAVWRGGALTTVFDLSKLVILTFLLIVIVDTKDRLRWMLWCMATVSAWIAGSSLLAFAQGRFYALNYDLGTLDRAQGINSMVGGPNELAGLLLALLPLSIALLRDTRNVLARLLLVVCGFASLAAISLSGSRIAAVGLIVMAIYYTIQAKNKILTCAACLLITCLVWTALPKVYQQRYLTVESYAQGGRLDASNELRLEVWKAGEQIFLYSPLVGVGAGQFPTAYGLIYLGGAHKAWMNPHNLLIQVACELGIVGLLAFCYFLWQIVKGIRFVLRNKGSSGTELNYQMAVACSVMCGGVLILSLVSHTLYRPYWYLLAGLVAANRNIACSTLKSRSKPEAAEPEEFEEDAESAEPSLAEFGTPDSGIS